MRTPRSQRLCGDNRGSAEARRCRKRWLLIAFESRCYHCHGPVTFDTVEADRIIPGGSYTRENLLASCGPCNRLRSNKPLGRCVKKLRRRKVTR